MPDHETDNELRDILEDAKTIAVVGMSNNAARPSFAVGDYLHKQGYRVLPVNPIIDQVLGVPACKSLRDIKEHVHVVDIFRRPEDVGPVVDDAIAIGADVVWMQLGIVNDEAARKARQAGLKVVMNHCMKVEHRRLIGEGDPNDSGAP
jgi:predicted CoA-binding protein